MNVQRSLPPSAPARGSFPLDHGGKCKRVADAYLACIRSNEDEHNVCKQLSREYLECRMRVNLMAPEDLNTLGFGVDAVVVAPAAGAHALKRGDVIAGLSGAKKGKGGFLGLQLPGLTASEPAAVASAAPASPAPASAAASASGVSAGARL